MEVCSRGQSGPACRWAAGGGRTGTLETCGNAQRVCVCACVCVRARENAHVARTHTHTLHTRLAPASWLTPPPCAQTCPNGSCTQHALSMVGPYCQRTSQNVAPSTCSNMTKWRGSYVVFLSKRYVLSGPPSPVARRTATGSPACTCGPHGSGAHTLVSAQHVGERVGTPPPVELN